MLDPTLDTIRLFIHVLAAAVWIGGQITLAGLVPVMRRHHPDSTKDLARGFSRIAWPSFLVLVVSGVWNIFEVDLVSSDWSYSVTVFIHMGLAFLAAIFTVIHSFGRTKVALALGGALGAMFSLGALFAGMLLKTGA